MADWIKMRVNLTTDPDVLAIGEISGVDEFSVVGRLHAVWGWADQHSLDGQQIRVTDAFIDRLSQRPGFAAAMRKVGWLEGRDGHLTFPRFDRHNGQTAKQRALTTDRVKHLRNARSVTPALPEKIREEKKNKAPPPRARARASLEEAEEYGKSQGWPVETVRHWWAHRDGQGWERGNGRFVTNWHSDLMSWVMSEKSHLPGPSSIAASGGSKIESVWSLEKRIEAAQAEIKAIETNPANRVKDEGQERPPLTKAALEAVHGLKTRISQWKQKISQ